MIATKLMTKDNATLFVLKLHLALQFQAIPSTIRQISDNFGGIINDGNNDSRLA